MAVSFCGKRLLLTRTNLFANPRRHGYIVLVPEIGEDLPEKNPLSSSTGLPEFNNDPLPEPCVEAIQRRRTHLAGYRLCRELYLANLDLQLHLTSDYWLDVMRKLYPHYHPFPLDRKDAHPCSLVAIASGDWGAAYYGHLWSRMIAADVYSAFAEAKEPAARQEVGRRFRDTFLALGGGCHPGEVFRRFRGRDPSPTALLQTLGIYKPQTVGGGGGSAAAHPKAAGKEEQQQQQQQQ
uniref:Peptidase M3A/M3B catalytic domain-containing protein n=1 Tax=Anopheles coluzzii TaxID=1518534 RepID=A0A8W7P555_ANOCL